MRPKLVYGTILYLCVASFCSALEESPILNSVSNPSDENLLKEIENLLKEQKYEEAASLYKKLLEKSPDNIDYLLKLGLLEVRLGHHQKATELYNQALKIDPNNEQIKINLAFAYLFSNDLEKSEQVFKDIQIKSPDNADALSGLGYINLLRSKKSETEAEELFNQILKQEPDHLTARIYLGNLRLLQNRNYEAKDIFEKLNAENPGNPDVEQGLREAIQQISFSPPQENEEDKELLEKTLKEKELLEKTLEERTLQEKTAQDKFLEEKELFEKALKEKELLKKTLEERTLQEKAAQDEVLKEKELLDKALKEKEVLEKTLEEKNVHEKTAQDEVLKEKELLKKTFEERTLQEQAAQDAAQDAARDEVLKEKQLQKKAWEETSTVEHIRFLREEKDYEQAVFLMEQLLDTFPDRIDYILLLGAIYVEMKERESAICLYNDALSLHPQDKDLLRALGFVYLYKALEDNDRSFIWKKHFPFLDRDYSPYLFISQEYFEQVLEQDPYDAEALAGIGRLILIQGCEQEAENFYFESLNIESDNITALSYLASLQSWQKKYDTADEIYQYFLYLDPKNEDNWLDYKEFLNNKKSFAEISAYYEEENEKDRIIEDWSARLKTYGVSFSFDRTLKDQLKFLSSISFDYIDLENLLTGVKSYSLESKRATLGLNYQLSTYLSLTGAISFTFFDQHKDSVFTTKSRLYYQPNFNITYSKTPHTCSLETLGDTALVARNFLTNECTLIARQFLNWRYELDLGKQRTLGALASYVWYFNRIQSNQMHTLSTHLRLTPPIYWENISLTYQFNYSRFNTLSVDYYTFQPQISHWLKIDLTKKWFCDQIITEAGYQHCWQRSFEQGQIIIVTPIPSFHWINRKIHAAYARVKIAFSDDINAGITGSYSHDNFDYTTASAAATLNIKF